MEGPWRSSVWHVNGTSSVIARSTSASPRHVLLLCSPLMQVWGDLQRGVVQSSSRPKRLAPYVPVSRKKKPSQNLGNVQTVPGASCWTCRSDAFLICDCRHGEVLQLCCVPWGIVQDRVLPRRFMPAGSGSSPKTDSLAMSKQSCRASRVGLTPGTTLYMAVLVVVRSTCV